MLSLSVTYLSYYIQAKHLQRTLCLPNFCVPFLPPCALQLILNQLPDLHSIWGISLMGATTSILYSGLGIVAPLTQVWSMLAFDMVCGGGMTLSSICQRKAEVPLKD